MTFGERLRTLRKSKGLNQRDLASHLDVSFTYLSKLENDRMERPPSEALIRSLARELDASSDELLLLAERVPTDVANIIIDRPESVELLRSTQSLSKDEWVEMMEMISRQKDKK